MRPAAILAALAVLACGAGMTRPSDVLVYDGPVLIGAGDIGQCGSAGALATGTLLDSQPGRIFAAGDLAYPDGTHEQFLECYEPAWGRHKARTHPAPGNHEYGVRGAAVYFAYFGTSAGPSGRGYYRYRVGTWDVFSLNSNLEGPERAAELQWLARELSVRSAECTLAYFHHPRFSSGPHGLLSPPNVVPDLWQLLYAAGVEVVISAHEHFYERFAPQDPSGVPDVAYGIRQFIVGTGGAQLTQPVRRIANSEVTASAFGLLRLSLDAGSYRWNFLQADAGASLDSGTGLCHGTPDK